MGGGQGRKKQWLESSRSSHFPPLLSRPPLPLSADIPAAVLWFGGSEEGGGWGEGAVRGALQPGLGRSGLCRLGPPYTRSMSAASSPVIPSGDHLLVPGRVLKSLTHRRGCGSYFRDWEFYMWDRSWKNKMNLRRSTKMVGNFFNRILK